MSHDEFVAEVEYIEPLDQVAAYGGEELLADLLNVSQLEGEGPDISPELAEALNESDYAAAESFLPAIRDWFSKPDDRYTVLGAGSISAEVPLLMAAAANVPDLQLVVTQETSRAVTGEVALKIGGTGVGASAKVTVSESMTLTCSAGEILVASVLLPVYWERRARLESEDFNWLHTEIDRVSGSLPVRFRKLEAPLEASVLSTLLADNREGGKKAAEITRSCAVEVGADFSVGLKIDAIGLDTSLKVTAEASLETKLEAALPAGHHYQVAWLGGPWGVRVSPLS